jgi:hypothetical protein
VAASRRVSVAIGAAVLATLAASLPAADDDGPQLGVQVHTFQDSRGVTVASPSFDLSRDFTDRTSLRVKFGVDAISAASDSCVRCHSQGVTSARGVLGASIVRKLGRDARMTVGAELSQENFYRSTTILASASRTLNKANTTVAGGFSFSLNQPTLHPSHESRSQAAENAFVSVTQTLTKSTVAQAGYEVAHIGGYQNDPFLRVRVNDVLVLGNNPDTRLRHTFVLRLRQALPAATYLEADYRHYFDDWSLRSNTFELAVSHQVTTPLLLRVGYRRYRQTAVSFYQPEYFGSPELFTSDFRLLPFSSHLLSGSSVYTPRDGLLFLHPGTSLTVQYERYSSDTDFLASIVTVGVRVPLHRRRESR